MAASSPPCCGGGARDSSKSTPVRAPGRLGDVLVVLVPLAVLAWRVWPATVAPAPSPLLAALRQRVTVLRSHAECAGTRWSGAPLAALAEHLRPRFGEEAVEALTRQLRAGTWEAWGARAAPAVDDWRVEVEGTAPRCVSRTEPPLWLALCAAAAAVAWGRARERRAAAEAARLYRRLLTALRAARLLNPLDALPELRLLDAGRYAALYRRLNALRLADGRAALVPRGSQHLWALL